MSLRASTSSKLIKPRPCCLRAALFQRRHLATPVEDGTTSPLAHLATPSEWPRSATGLRWPVAAGLPPPPRPITLGPRQRNRYDEHYHTTLAPDLVYLTYDHHLVEHPMPDPIRPDWDPLNPYAKGRPPMPLKTYAKNLVPKAKPLTEATALTVLECITVSASEGLVVKNKSLIIPLMTALSQLTGERVQTPIEAAARSREGVIVTRTTNRARRRGARPGALAGVKVHLTGQSMFTFLETLVELVLPRCRNFRGLPLPERGRPGLADGTVSFRLPDDAFGLFPSIEPVLHQFHQPPTLHINCTTNATGPGAQDRARSLISGFRVPVRA